MYAHKSYGYNALVKSVLHQGTDKNGGFSESGGYAWIACAGRLHIWRSQDGSYAALTTLWSPGVLQHVWVYHYPNTGALTVAACATNGDLHTWLDANTSPNPITTPLRSGQGTTYSNVVAFSASAVTGPDAPGFVAAASFSNGSLAMASAARGRVSCNFLKDPASATVAPRGIFSAINDAVGVHEEQSWMHALMGGEGRWWLQRAIGSFVGTTHRDHASGSPCQHLWLQHNGGAAWVVLALTEDTLDCWRVSHMGGARDVSAQCMWSYPLGVAFSRFERHTVDPGALLPLRLQVQGDAVCVLCAVKERRGRNVPNDGWSPALALLKLPPVASSRVWATVPDCHFFKKLPFTLPEGSLAQHGNEFSLCMRPDAAAVSSDSPDSVLITLLFPRFDSAGGHKGSQLVAWHASGAAAPVLDQVADALALTWTSEGGCWQLLSPIFGVLLLQEAAASDSAASLPVTPLLEAAVGRQRAGDGMPGLAEALAGLGALASPLPPRRNAVAEFSHALVNSLTKSSLIGGGAAATAEVLLHKQQSHGALLQCLHSARLLEHGAAPFSGPALPQDAIFEIFQHAEHLSAVCCVYHDCSVPTASTAQRTELLEALALASRDIEAPSTHHVTASDWAFSSPSPNLPLLMRGITDACADSVPSARSSFSSAEPSGIPSAAARVAALTDLACAAFRGARSARQAAAVQYGAAYEPRLQRGAGGWLGGPEVRDACMTLAQRCLTVCGSPSGEWTERLLQLCDHLVASYKSAVDQARTEAEAEAVTDALVEEAQAIASGVLAAVRAASGVSPTVRSPSTALMDGAAARRPVAEDPALRQRLQALASRPLESASQRAPEPRLVSVEHLLALAEEHIAAAHVTSVEAAGRPNEQLQLRLLAELSNQLKGFASPVVATLGTTPLSSEERAAQQRLQGFMLQHLAFMRHTLLTLCSGHRVVELLLLPSAFSSHIQQFLASDERWRGFEWLYHNARGNFPEASSALSALVRNGDASGHSADLLVPAGLPRKAMSARAAMLNKATLLVKIKTGLAGSSWELGQPGAAQQPRSQGSMGGPGVAEMKREYEEAQVMLSALRLRSRVEGATASTADSGAGRAVDGLDIDAVIAEAAASDDPEILLEGVSVASRVAACGSVWLERQRHGAWAALWSALAGLDLPRFQTAIAATEARMGLDVGDLSGSVVDTGFRCTAQLLRGKPAQVKMATDAALGRVTETLHEATGSDKCSLVLRDMLDRALAGAGLHAAA